MTGSIFLPLDECLELTGHSNLKRLRTDALALSACGVVTLDDDEVGLSRSSWEQPLLAKLTPTLRRELHLRVAGLLAQRPDARFRTIQHRLLAGQVERALDMLLTEIKANRPLRIEDSVRAFECFQSLPKNWPETYHALISECRGLGRPLRDRLDLELELVAYATLGARSERRTVVELGAQLRHDAGLDLIEELAGHVPADELLTKALGAAQQRYDATPERERVVGECASLPDRRDQLTLCDDLPRLPNQTGQEAQHEQVDLQELAVAAQLERLDIELKAPK